MDQDALKKKIEAALRKACLPDKAPRIELEPSNVHRLGGRVISKRFEMCIRDRWQAASE